MRLCAGEWVEIRSKEEILGTLDKNGRMEGLPFMPQMFQYCGQRFKIYKRAHKTCDFVYTGSSRWLLNGIHLDLRCDGVAYGGCQHACLLYWKEAWLKRVDEERNSVLEPLILINTSVCTEADVSAGTHTLNELNEVIYTCQGTEIPHFTKPLPWWDIRQYIEDYTSGNASISRLLKGFAYGLFQTIENSGMKLGRPLRWLYDLFEPLWGPYPRRPGKIPQGQPTPFYSLDLQVGELVRVKSYNEILATLNKDGKNRGLQFDAELVPYCGKIFRVKDRVTTFIDEKTRKLVTLKNPSIILEGVYCQSRHSKCRMICPRSILSWWREIWLERVAETTDSVATSVSDKPTINENV
ncbi:hypothetical protein MGMO_204c00020 [Methyloglobulus morosus KoM1]|uniref:Uncharacterized protein n=1 Tax=Methyloglobulus morosus KoM1 TaxID=1116472 RepID=V5BEL0_9GAMM|nr:hypothetical protein [Methyloglobulus morosus]ESS66174.1 hypothetical protein MGMO_204c00020 [Methyloglobulus morosus KoM1]